MRRYSAPAGAWTSANQGSSCIYLSVVGYGITSTRYTGKTPPIVQGSIWRPVSMGHQPPWPVLSLCIGHEGAFALGDIPEIPTISLLCRRTGAFYTLYGSLVHLPHHVRNGTIDVAPHGGGRR